MRLLRKFMTTNNSKSLATKLLSISFLSVFIFTISVSNTYAFEFIESMMWNIVNNVLGLILGYAGIVLNLGINEYVVGFGKNFLDSNLGTVVAMLWGSVRDIFNLTFIFGLVYIGFKMILNSDDSNTRHWLVYLILAALMVNFSLYITQFIVDLTNITATQIVNSGFSVSPTSGEIDVSGTLMDSLGLQSTWSHDLPKALTEDNSSPWGYIFGTAILFMVATFVFAAGGILLMIRYAVLILYMILSPIMFLGWVFPQMQSYTSKYWKGFLGRAFFAPIYLLIVYFSVKIIDVMYSGGTPDFLKTLAGSGDEIEANFVNTIPPFILASIFLLSAVIIAGKLGADGAGASLKVGKALRGSVQRGVGNATVGTAAWGMRNTAGQASHKLVNNETFKGYASRHSLVGKGAFSAAQKVAGSSFDARNAGNLGSSLGIGSGKKGGFTKSISDKSKADERFVKDTEAVVDMNDPAVLAKVAKKKEEIEKAADKGIEQEEGVSATLASDATKNPTSLQTEISKLDDSIKTKQQEHDVHKTAETMTTKDLAEMQEKIETSNTVLSTKKSILKQAQKREKIDKEISELNKQITAATNDVDRTELGNKLNSKTEEKTNNSREYKAMQTASATRMVGLEAKKSNAGSGAIAETKYANAITYMDELQNTEKFWNRTGTRSVGGALGFVATGGAVAGLMVGAHAAGAQSYSAQQSRQNLERKYGRDGTTMTKTDKQLKQAKINLEAQNDLTGTPSASPTPAPAPNPPTV